MTVTMIYRIYYRHGWRELPIKLSLNSQKSFLLSPGHSQRHQTREHPAGPLTSTWTGNRGMLMWWSVNSPTSLITFDWNYRSNFQLGLVLQFLSGLPYSNSISWNNIETIASFNVGFFFQLRQRLTLWNWPTSDGPICWKRTKRWKKVTPIVSPTRIQWLRPSVSKIMLHRFEGSASLVSRGVDLQKNDTNLFVICLQLPSKKLQLQAGHCEAVGWL